MPQMSRATDRAEPVKISKPEMLRHMAAHIGDMKKIAHDLGTPSLATILDLAQVEAMAAAERERRPTLLLKS